MAERKLKNRKRRASKGQLIRVSDVVYNALDSGRRDRSWDWLLRRMLGLPDRAGNAQPLLEGYLEVMSGQFFLREPSRPWRDVELDAHEQAFKAAAKLKAKQILRPVRMRELP